MDDSVGQRIITARRVRRLTQQELADKAGISRSYLQKLETGSRPTSHSVLVKLARTMRVEVSRLTGQPYDTDPGPEDQLVHGVIPELRRVMLCYRDPSPSPLLPAREFEELYVAVEEVNRHRRAASYARVAPALPGLLTELGALALAETPGSLASREAYGLLAQVYRGVNSLAHKLGYLDLSTAALERVEWAARLSDDPLLVATARYLLAGAMLREGAYAPARRVLEQLERDLVDIESRDARGLFGAVLLKRVMVQARSGDVSAMRSDLDQAAEVAARLGGGDAVFYETAFGTAQVGIYRAAAAIEIGDYDTAVRDGSALVLPDDMPAERSSHHHIDQAHARLVAGDRGGAWESLRTARRIAPLHTRKHPRTRDTVGTLLRLERADDESRLGFARWAGVAI
ncbi:helix-turn-helix domain-containing protein [Embleya sp. NPDC059237]|uniref:helix-turn-helix domain-containing protein n=1 Tax=Embleya sp. NPDC059237 TaxID=3346784 RepID=UPI0036B4455B